MPGYLHLVTANESFGTVANSKYLGMRVTDRICIQEELEVKIVVSVLFLTEHHAMEAYWWSGGIVPRILYFGTRWR
jgi:hypothetical protein